MEQIKARVDALVQKLNDLSADVRLEAIGELGTIDKEHALPALHWAIQNELDEKVRNAARDAYQRLARAPDPPPRNAAAATVDKTRKIDRPRVKAVQLEEGAPNPMGMISLYIGLVVFAALVVERIVISGQDPNSPPAFFLYWRLFAGALSVPGLGLGIVGLTKKREKHLRAIGGTVINAVIVVIYFFTILLPMFRH
jgi:hypothetical protein